MYAAEVIADPVALAEAEALTPDPTKPHFEVLDGLRGVAAFCVFMVHCYSRKIATNGFLGVDFFFLLSGFVIASAYGQKLSGGRLSIRAFALRRVIRLWPMLVIGMVLGLLAALLHNATNHDARYPVRDLAEAFVLGLLLLPQPNVGSLGTPIFPLNTVLWSLLFEVCANVVYALFARFMGLGVAIALSLLGLIGTVAIGPLGGGSIPDVLWGIPRVAFGFFGGVALYLIWERGLTKRWPKLGLVWLSLPLLAITFVPYEIGGVWFILPAALFSAIILLGAHNHIGKLELRACIWLGALSYPVYLIHRPMLYFAPGIGKRFTSMDGPAYHVAVVAALAGTVVFSHLAVRFYETPTRRWLTGLTKRPRRPRVAAIRTN